VCRSETTTLPNYPFYDEELIHSAQQLHLKAFSNGLSVHCSHDHIPWGAIVRVMKGLTFDLSGAKMYGDLTLAKNDVCTRRNNRPIFEGECGVILTWSVTTSHSASRMENLRRCRSKFRNRRNKTLGHIPYFQCPQNRLVRASSNNLGG
jgi:hypothetical protein